MSTVTGRVASLHVHPGMPGAPMLAVERFTLVAGQGIEEDERYFGRVSRSTGRPSRRQVSLIEREQMAEHAAALGLEKIHPGAGRSNIETVGLDLRGLVGREVQMGEAVLLICEARTPCSKMDAICQGLRGLMEKGRQGVLAEVIQSGSVQMGDWIRARNV